MTKTTVKNHSIKRDILKKQYIVKCMKIKMLIQSRKYTKFRIKPWNRWNSKLHKQIHNWPCNQAKKVKIRRFSLVSRSKEEYTVYTKWTHFFIIFRMTNKCLSLCSKRLPPGECITKLNLLLRGKVHNISKFGITRNTYVLLRNNIRMYILS